MYQLAQPEYNYKFPISFNHRNSKKEKINTVGGYYFVVPIFVA